jgi:hypothetical protein
LTHISPVVAGRAKPGASLVKNRRGPARLSAGINPPFPKFVIILVLLNDRKNLLSLLGGESWPFRNQLDKIGVVVNDVQ